jgi:hypothetical protein
MDSDKACGLISKTSGSYVARHTVTQETLEALVALLGRPYWKRLWIVQEILLAKHCFFLCGEANFEQVDVTYLACNLTRYIFSGAEAFMRISSKPGYLLMRDASSNSGKFHLRDLRVVISKYGMHQCTDIKDRIFRLLSLVNFKDQHPIIADYSLSREELCQLVSSHISHSLYSGAKNEHWEKRLRKLLELDETPPLQSDTQQDTSTITPSDANEASEAEDLPAGPSHGCAVPNSTFQHQVTTPCLFLPIFSSEQIRSHSGSSIHARGREATINMTRPFPDRY